MIKKKNIQWVLLLFLGSILMSCEKVIDVNLNEADQRLVIEGNITSEAGPYEVLLTTSGGYFDNTAVQAVENGLVIISDENGNSETLSETAPGVYHTQSMQGIEGRNYSIRVEVEGETFEASEYLPPKVAIDSLYAEIDNFGGPGGPNAQENNYNIYVTLSDPVESVDYYRFVTWVNGMRVYGGFATYRLLDDELFNGTTFTVTLRRTEAQPGDTVQVQLQSIGFNTYEYFNTINETLNAGGRGSTPFNPISNIDNGALGYFGAYSYDSQTIIVE